MVSSLSLPPSLSLSLFLTLFVLSTTTTRRLQPPRRSAPFLPGTDGGDLRDAFMKSAKFFAENKPVGGGATVSGITRKDTFSSVALQEASSAAAAGQSVLC